ncbi:hypothetical protein BTO30_00565 [Domibacillus antri]|uniref:Schlafen AlbA-2 domain-containing protein n=1 Tax=Domibacillus antri TaxID=1714264 RepID=A0A1Q8Q9L2_9BACI|nr:ATP-binding protein [Domibacillus antri]OLN23955.1 hypothetical protein BTO30_00565 [Domibacillus antri]
MLEIPLLEEIKNLIALKREGDYWDFKENHYENNANLLHDIICMANNRADRDGYIILGVSDNFVIKGTEGDTNRKNQQNLIDFLKDKQFAGGVRPTIEMHSLQVDKCSIDVIIIKNTTDTPYYLNSEFKCKGRVLKAYHIYTRIGDTNTNIDKSADINHVEYLWKKRFLLNKPPLEQIKNKLRNKEEWRQKADVYYNIYSPEFTVCLLSNYEEKKPVFYSYLMTNQQTYYGILELRYFGTNLYSQEFAVLDSGRYTTVVPNSGFIGERHSTNGMFYYRYFIKDSLEYILHEFLSTNDDEALWARSSLYDGIIIYKNIVEKELFEEFLDSNRMLLEELIDKKEDSISWDESDNLLEKKDVQIKLKTAKVFNQLLREYRNGDI